MAKKMASQGDTSIKDNLRWTEEMDVAFLDALIEECSKGNRVEGTFTTTAYDNVLATLKASFGNHLRKDNLKNRLKTLKDHFGVCYDLFHNLSGFSWNPETKLFTAESEVWADLIKARPDAKKWMRTPIKHYDKLYFIYGQDRATGNIAGSAKERNKSMAKMKETINLNEDEYQGFDCEWNDWQPTTHSTSFVAEKSPDLGNSNQSNGTQGNHRGSKRKAPMSGLFEADMERMSKGIQGLTDMLKDGNNYYDKSLDIASKQVLTAERQAETAEKQVMLAERQVLIAEEQIQVAKIQAQAVERGITFLEQSRARIYSENDVYNELKKLGVVKRSFGVATVFSVEMKEQNENFLVFPLKIATVHYMT
ncbi:uncharacterized protein At2g29880-like [Arachis duranensis]|uniref:Uncharacterized protein At2g29880-like n=1 Tax=Arachis duranensis TaxID=130453 RepID=A0A9C6TL65_ARADU|nr:uncharacterized protein At2g29880-like [Arachis duranensis]XP_052110774.1 uncharacterized protein At2g29880-like [Arachis duranensis]